MSEVSNEMSKKDLLNKVNKDLDSLKGKAENLLSFVKKENGD